MSIGATGLGMLGGFIGAYDQHRREQQLMGVQHRNQMELNQQGHDLQYEMWKKTNYPAQIEMLKQAGLNPALFYKGGGPGGTTGSQTGGSAAKGSAVAPRVMDMSNLMIKSGIDLNKANAAKARAEAEAALVDARKKEGVDTDEARSRIALNEINTKYREVETRIKDATEPAEIDQAFEDLAKTKEESKQIGLDNQVKAETIDEEIRLKELDVIQQTLENQFKAANIDYTEAKIEEISESIEQKWFKLGLDESNMNIDRFKAELEAEYPGLSKVWGKMANDVYDFAGYLDYIWAPNKSKAFRKDPNREERRRGIRLNNE